MKNAILRTACQYAIVASILLIGKTAVAAPCGVTAPNITGAQYNTYRTSANQSETALTPATVSSGFGYLYQLKPTTPVQAYTQPLIVHNFTIAGTCRATVVFLATMTNQILAFDGDNETSSAPIWTSQVFGTAGEDPVAFPAIYCRTNVGFKQAGILGTPVIETTHLLMYFVTLNDTSETTTCTAQGSDDWVYTLHAISLKNDSSFGLDYIPAHDINPDLAPYGFNATHALQRPALLDIAGNIFVGFGFGTSSTTGTELNTSYQGWMAQYNSCATDAPACPTTTCVSQTNCQFFYTSTSTPAPLAPHGAGVWMSGVGPASDGTYYAFSTGNGCTPSKALTEENCAPIANNALGDSVVYGPGVPTGGPGSSFTPEDSFETPSYMNYYVDDYNDLDLSSGGVLMIPPTVPHATVSYLVASGKAGQTYLLETSNLGGYTTTPYQGFLSALGTAPCTTPFPVSPQQPLYGGIVPYGGGCPEIHNPAYWSVGGGTGFYFVWGFSDVPRGYFFNGSTMETSASSATPPIVGPATSYGGGALAISSNGIQRNTAILWAVTSNGFASKSDIFEQGALQAFQLYSASGQNEIVNIYNSATTNGSFNVLRYVVPLVNNGKVYVSALGNGNDRIYVYGPCSQGPNGACGTQP
jgi:hypothetical protein